MKKIAVYSLILFVSLAFSCHKKEPEPDCGCEGSTVKKIENARAVYFGSGYFSVLGDDANKSSYPYLLACKIDSTWQKSTDFKVADYTISGKMKLVCPTDFTLTAQPSPMEITTIKKD